MLDRSEIEQIAENFEFKIAAVEKSVRLLEVLDQIADHPALHSKLTLKGGTALNLFFGPPPRLSVDIDFNYIGSPARDEMLKERPKTAAAITAIGGHLGYFVQTKDGAHAGQSWYFGYTSLLRSQDRIEVDISFTNRIPLLPPSFAAPFPLGGAAHRSSLIESVESLVVGKFCALIDRVAARDVFDAGWVTDLVLPENFQLVKRLFVLMSGTLHHSLTTYSTDRIDRLTQQEIDGLLAPVASGTSNLDRAHLVALCRAKLEPFLQLDDQEREYCAAINRGDYRPELLLSEWPETCERLRHHPALVWKAENARKKRR